MVHCSTGTRGGRLESRFDDVLREDYFAYEEITELLIFLAKKRARKNNVPLRKSLFPHVSPYVIFRLYDGKGDSRALPKVIADHLTWELGAGTPWIVRKTVENSGFRFVSGREKWCGTWSESKFAISYKVLKSHQKMNHFPGTYEIGHKDRLWKNVSRLMSIFGKKQFGFIPRTFILPEEFDRLRCVWETRRTGNKWILKPPASSRGRGVSVVSRWTQIPRKRSSTLIQRYLSRPKLINDSKFDIRVYALVTDFDPLKIYIYEEGLVRFACVSYDRSDLTQLGNRFMHLTNYSVNKFCPDYVNNDTVGERKGHKWSLKCLWDYLGEQKADVAGLKSKIHDIIVKAIIAGEASVNCFSRVHLNSKHSCFELLGVDILIDEDMRPWLLEVNISPSLHAPSALDLAVKGHLVKDALNVAGFRIPPITPSGTVRKKAAKLGLDLACPDVHAGERELTIKEKRKQTDFMYRTLDRGDSSNGPESIIHRLTPDDVRCLVRYEDEISRLGKFQRVFPTPETHKYFRYFEGPRYYNMLLSAWEIAHGNDRQSGIIKLRDLCDRKFHLR
ncbi:tubulin monoglutamylase TTLL4-like [Athalia rosae]|uniref:tubulin monoglutamylase TTLL4-like n=1 Tax=Athalia rosae TaxID=37344 RepID=UPI0020342EE6|nr:tubulin monoglutamylase TTLL4-like [Athalia rosae]